jgi:3-methyladenine DNA glycosylase/8-oxoguanine DNA glycosylase
LIERAVRPRGPYSLVASARLSSDATRRFRGGVLTSVLAGGEVAAARQLPDGTVVVRASSLDAIERACWILAVDDDHSEFLHRFRDDPLLGRTLRHLRGTRVVRVPTVAHSLLRALCGQLVDWKTARRLERRVLTALTPMRGELHEPPAQSAFARCAPAELRRLGLHARRAATLVRICRSLDLERLRDVPPARVAERLGRERGVGPWSVGVVGLEGLGRHELPLVGDLGLIKLCAALSGRAADAADTAELLAPYREWAGLASVYLLTGAARGLVPGAGLRAA